MVGVCVRVRACVRVRVCEPRCARVRACVDFCAVGGGGRGAATLHGGAPRGVAVGHDARVSDE